jgi:hypothetical protein
MIRYAMLLLTFAVLCPGVLVAETTITLLWQREARESSFAISDAGDRVLLRVGEHPGENYIVLLDGAGNELWCVGPKAGCKFYAADIEESGKRAIYTETRLANPKAEHGAVISKVVLLNAVTGKPLQGKEFPPGQWIYAEMRNYGRWLLCHDISAEESGLFVRLYDISGPAWKERWRLEKVTPTLNLSRTHPDGRAYRAYPAFWNAQLLPFKNGTVLSDGKTLFHIDHTGYRHWELDSGKQSCQLAAVSPAGDLLVVQSNEYDAPWPWRLRRPGPNNGELFESDIRAIPSRIGVYLLGDWFKQQDPLAMRLVAGLTWPEVNVREADGGFGGAAVLRNGDTAVLAVFSTKRSMLYRLDLFPEEFPTQPFSRELAGVNGNQVWSAWSRTGLLATSSPGVPIDRYHGRAHFALFDFTGTKLWEDGTHEGTHGRVALTADGTRLYAYAGHTLYCYQIARNTP